MKCICLNQEIDGKLYGSTVKFFTVTDAINHIESKRLNASPNETYYICTATYEEDLSKVFRAFKRVSRNDALEYLYSIINRTITINDSEFSTADEVEYYLYNSSDDYFETVINGRSQELSKEELEVKLADYFAFIGNGVLLRSYRLEVVDELY